MKVKVFAIKWDTEDSCSEEKVDIPTEMVLDVPDNIWDDAESEEEKAIEIENFIADKISDISGFCHDGFDYEIVKKKFKVPFQAKELVWNNCVPDIEVNTKAVETEIFNYMEEVEVSDVKEAEKYSFTAGFEIFDLLRWEKDAVYTMVEEQIPGIKEISEMDIIPIGIQNQYVILKFIPTKYKE